MMLFADFLKQGIFEKAFDKFLMAGDIALFMIGMMVCEELRKSDLSSFDYSRAKGFIREKSLGLERLRVAHRLLNCGSDDKYLRSWISKHGEDEFNFDYG